MFRNTFSSRENQIRSNSFIDFYLQVKEERKTGRALPLRRHTLVRVRKRDAEREERVV